MEHIKPVIGPGKKGIGKKGRACIFRSSHHQSLKCIHFLPVDPYHGVFIRIAVNGGPEGLSHCIFRTKQKHGAVRIHNHIFPSSKHIPLIEIPSVNHIHRLYLFIIGINPLKIKADGGALIFRICRRIGIAVNIGNFIRKCLLCPLHFIQIEIIAVPYILYPVSDPHISLSNTHILIELSKHSPHGISNGNNGNHRSDADNDPQHGKNRTELIGPDRIKSHHHVFR